MSEAEQYADRITSVVRRRFMDCLDDDVIGRLGKSHMIFGKACAMEAIDTAMREAKKPSTNPGNEVRDV